MSGKQLIVGMPGSGKTTYLAALRTQLDSSHDSFMLRLAKLSSSEAHVNKLEEKWLSCEELDHTATGADEWIELHLRETATGELIDICLPDISGEAFQQPASTGQCRKSLYDAMEGCSGVALFTNADKGIDDLLINDVLALVEGEDDDERPFSSGEMPEEVNIIELLQVFNRRPLKSKQRKLAVVVSAWDVVQDQMDPIAWLESHRPMLYQFLCFNREQWNWRVYGVSAQGGRLPADKDRLQAILDPALRAKVVERGNSGSDLSRPLHWLIESES